MRMRNPGKYLLAGCVVTSVLVAAPLALGAGEGKPVNGGARNPSNNESQAYTQETQIISNLSGYGTRQSNKSDDGGGAIYGCRATNTASNTCVRATNLANGQAFSFNANGGNQVGSITSSNKNAAPFTTNATGVATGLNADQVDGQSASQIQTAASTAAVTSANKFAVINGASGGLAERPRRHLGRAHLDRRLHGDGVGDHQRLRLRSDGAERDGGDRDGRPRWTRRTCRCGRSWTTRRPACRPPPTRTCT